MKRRAARPAAPSTGAAVWIAAPAVEVALAAMAEASLANDEARDASEATRDETGEPDSKTVAKPVVVRKVVSEAATVATNGDVVIADGLRVRLAATPDKEETTDWTADSDADDAASSISLATDEAAEAAAEAPMLVAMAFAQ